MERYRVRANYDSKASSHISLPPKPPISSNLQPQTPKLKADHAEISIFDAERYFNECDEALNKKKAIILNGFTNSRDSWVNSIDGHGYSTNLKNRSFRATPTASSEASWNSQTGLLANRPGSVAVSMKAYPLNENKKGSFLGRRFFGRNCPCYGKKSVDVEERSSQARTPTRASIGIAKMEMESMEVAKVKIWASEKSPAAEVSRRILNSSSSSGFSFPVMPPEAIKGLGLEEQAREYLEVFRPGELATTSLRKWDGKIMRIPPIFNDADRPSITVPDDDAMSDTSSDLFEIDSFSANSTVQYCRRESLDDLPKVGSEGGPGILHLRQQKEEPIVPSECYVPSEVSIQWSVTTAEDRFDRTSVSASDFGDNRFVPVDSTVENGGSEAKKRGGGGLLNCRGEKAVSVGPIPVRLVHDQQQRLPTGPELLSARLSSPVQT